MTPTPGLRALALAAALAAPPARAGDKPPAAGEMPAAPPAAAAGADAVQDLVFLGEHRPIFFRLRMSLGPRPFRVAWMDSVRAMHALLDRDGDGAVSKAEADKDALATLVRVANGGATAMPRGDLDMHPKDGVVSIDELTDALRTALGPFRVQLGRLASGKTDALFDRLDRDGDGKLGRDELRDAAATLGKFDLDDDELIDGAELEPFADPTALQVENMPGQRARAVEAPLVVELSADDSSIRPVRLLLKKYDRGAGPVVAGGDNKLSAAEFPIDPKAFARADADADGALDTEELRRFLARATPDIELKIGLSADASGAATVAVGGAGDQPLPPWASAKPLGPGDVEIAADEVRLEVHVDDGAAALADARRTYTAQFMAADTDNNGYVEKSELAKDKNHPSPLAGLFDLLDRDADGKLYPKELDEFVDRQSQAARDRMVLTTSDQGRAIFSILDLNRDRRLGHREIAGTPARVATWDWNGDGRITAEEIPHHYQLTVGRGRLAGVGTSDTNAAGTAMNPDAASAAAGGPSWFRRMDRNHDGDVSRREFRGPKDQFDRLDRDADNFLDAAEAAAATATATADRAKPPGK